MFTVSAGWSLRTLNSCQVIGGTTTMWPGPTIDSSPSTIISRSPSRITKVSAYGCRCLSAPVPVTLFTTKNETGES